MEMEMKRRIWTTEEKKQAVKQIDQWRNEGLTIANACIRAGLAYSRYYEFKAYPEGRKKGPKFKILKDAPSKPPIEVMTLSLPVDKQVFLFQGTSQDLENLIRLRGN